MVKGAIFCVSLAFSLSAVCFADDKTAQDLLSQSTELFNQRQAFGKEDPALLDQIEEKLSAAIKEVQDADLKYDILVAHSKTLYWKGNHTSEKEPAKKVFESGYRKAEEAKAINADYPEAYYYYAVNLARWAKKNGIVESLQRKGELMDNLNKILERTTRDGIAGEEIEYFGANRVLGKMYYELPGFAGGSRSNSIANLSVAHEKAPNHSLNVIYYAEALSKGTKDEGAKACAILKEMLAKNPADMTADRVPETIEDFEDAKEMIAKLRCR